MSGHILRSSRYKIQSHRMTESFKLATILYKDNEGAPIPYKIKVHDKCFHGDDSVSVIRARKKIATSSSSCSLKNVHS